MSPGTPPRPRSRGSPARSRTEREMTYLEAISDALRTEMRSDESVVCLGEDIGAFGGAFKVTDGFLEEFGGDRVIDMPLAENAIIGAAVGAAIEGLRPVCEMQFADFIACGFDQLVNVAAKMHYRQGIAVPMVRAAAFRWRLLRRPVPLPEPGGLVHAGAGSEGGGAGQPGRCQGPADRRDPRSQPGLLPRAQGPLPLRPGQVPDRRARRRAGQGERRARGRGDVGHRLWLERAAGARGGRGARRIDRGDRPAQPLPARHGGDPRHRRQDRQGSDCPRGDPLAAVSAPRSPR